MSNNLFNVPEDLNYLQNAGSWTSKTGNLFPNAQNTGMGKLFTSKASSAAVKKAGKGGWFSKGNAAKTAKIAGAWQVGLSILSSIFDKTKRGQPGPTGSPTIALDESWKSLFGNVG